MRVSLQTITNLNSTQSKRIKELEAKIQDLQKLQPGWDYGEGEAISDNVARRALSLVEYGLTLGLSANVRPSIEGELIVTLFSGDKFLFVSIRPDGTYDTTYEKGKGVHYEILGRKNNLQFSTLLKYISSWALSELSTLKDMTLMQVDSQVRYLKNIEMEKSPSLMNNVHQMPAMDLYADISNNTTKPRLATRYYFAESM